MSIEATLGRIASGEDLAADEMAAVIDAIMRGQWPDAQIALLLTALRAKGESCGEVAGAAMALRRHMTPIATRRSGLVDTCGTGGDGSQTFNISTAAAIVAAAVGVPVAKHGNRAATSRSGSADVLAALGVDVNAPLEAVERSLDESGLCFCFAPLFHGAMKRVSTVRKQLGFPTIFNLLGPLANPARAPYQLIGVGRPELRPLLADALVLLGGERAIVVHGRDGLDEVTLAAATDVSEVRGGKVREFVWTPEDFGLQRQNLESLRIDGPEASAAIIRDVLAGRPGPARDIVTLNAAAALWVADFSSQPAACAAAAKAAIDSGAAARLLATLGAGL